MTFSVQKDMRTWAFLVMAAALLVPGCTGPSATEPTTDAADIGSPARAPRQQESLEFSGRLPVTFRGVNATTGNSNFTAVFGRPGNYTTIEITISIEKVKAPGYVLTVAAEGREHSSGFEGTEPYVFNTDLRGPYEVLIRANGPDVEGTSWKANVTQYFRS